MRHSAQTSNRRFRPVLISLALWMGAAGAALAEDEPRMPADAVEIDVRDNATIRFSETNVIETGDVIHSIVGVSGQFRDGQMIIGELFFETPMALAELTAMAESSGSSAMALHCARAGLFQVEGHDVISGEGCVVVPNDENDERKS
ncbi:MAG TPA: hypothetical protein VL147_09540 [Devosia sp.]|nr:hypothetical protein [Devosia sp.]